MEKHPLPANKRQRLEWRVEWTAEGNPALLLIGHEDFNETVLVACRYTAGDMASMKAAAVKAGQASAEYRELGYVLSDEMLDLSRLMRETKKEQQYG